MASVYRKIKAKFETSQAAQTTPYLPSKKQKKHPYTNTTQL
jgi:hypothetical protein